MIIQNNLIIKTTGEERLEHDFTLGADDNILPSWLRLPLDSGPFDELSFPFPPQRRRPTCCNSALIM